jgi:hypothetical protein
MNDPYSAPVGLTSTEQSFIQDHLLDNVPDLFLQAHRYKEVDIPKVVGQIAARQKARYKLPAWYSNMALLFPPPLSVEQGSSEATARFKASLIAGTTLIDITGGMGVDCYYLSQRFSKTIYYDHQPEVARAAAYNFVQLGASGIDVRAREALADLDARPQPADWIYADPARRDDRQRKVAQLVDCTPDLTRALPVLFRSAPNLLVKTAPLLDIDLAVKQLGPVKEVYIVGLEGECKEVLYVLNEATPSTTEVVIKARLLRTDGSVSHSLDFTRQQEAAAHVTFREPLNYLYEPHAAILKAGAFKTLATQPGLSKLAPNTHLYTSELPIAAFPGRSFEVVAVCRPDARELARYVPDGKANLTIRNFPAKIDELRKKWRLKEGGDRYLFATELLNGGKVVIVTKKAYIE